MDVNQVRFGNYSIGNSNSGAKKSEEKEEQKPQLNEKAESTAKNVNADELFSAMNTAALQNKAQVNFTAKKSVQLDSDRVADIEAMMAEFESGVNNIAGMIADEFPSMSAKMRNDLAARIFAQG